MRCLNIIFYLIVAANGIKDLKLPVDYSPLKIPDWTSPIIVNTTINLRNIIDVNERDQLISLEASLRMIWQDVDVKPLLEEGEDFVSLHGKDVETLWIPDIFVDRAKNLRAPKINIKPATLRIYKGGIMRYSSRVNFDVACTMDFHRFPLDKQNCEIKFESFGYTTDQMRLQWDSSSSTVNANMSLDQFEPLVTFQDSYATDYYAKSYPGVILRISLQRKLAYHLTQTFIPSLLFVSLAWLSLLIDPSAVPGRVSMVMMTLLTIMHMFSSVRRNTPKVSYISMIDVWMVMCLLFVFLCLVEFSIVTALLYHQKNHLATKLEAGALVILPLIFIGFNLVYWPALFL